MKIIDLNEEQVEDIESRLSLFDENHIIFKMDGCIQIGVEDDGKLIAGFVDVNELPRPGIIIHFPSISVHDVLVSAIFV